jgi:hypothetical protein
MFDELSFSLPKVENQDQYNSAHQSRLQRVQIQTLSGVSWEYVDTESGKRYASLDAALNGLDLPLSSSYSPRDLRLQRSLAGEG